MDNVEEVLRWLDQAEADMKTARDCCRDGNYYASAFFAQQAAEKALQGFLYSRGYRALVTHSVLELLEEAAKLEGKFGEFLNHGKELDRHYIVSRYPNFYPSGAPYKFYTEEVAEKCLSYAEKVEKYTKRVVEELNPQAMILFGSFARGDINEGSDVDIVVIADFKEPFLDRIRILLDLSDEIGLPLEPIGYTPEEFQRMKGEGHRFIQEVLESGKILAGEVLNERG